jgi:photosystem II stability/assembly factor-like uncharacterized protein
MLPAIFALLMVSACGGEDTAASGSDVATSSGMRLWVLQAPNGVAFSGDGGRSWEVTSLPGDRLHLLKALDFVDRSTGWVAELSGVSMTSDGGRTWAEVLASPKEAGGPGAGYGLFDVASPDAEHAWVVGKQARNAPLVLTTDDGGKTWAVQSVPAGLPLFAVSFVSADHGWVVASDVTVHKALVYGTRNGGAVWRRQLATNHFLTDVAFADKRHGWVCGLAGDYGEESGVVFGTADGGRSWHLQLRADSALRGLAVVGPGCAWVVGDDGAIFRTRAGGSRWVRQESGTSEALTAVSFADTNHGSAVGWWAGTIATSDGGATWNALDPGGGNLGRYIDVRALAVGD